MLWAYLCKTVCPEQSVTGFLPKNVRDLLVNERKEALGGTGEERKGTVDKLRLLL